MQLQAFVPLVTYPEPPSDWLAERTTFVAAQLAAKLHVVALNVDIPDVSNALSKLLLDTPQMIRRAEATSRQRGEHLLLTFKEQCRAQGVEVETSAFSAAIPALTDTAASRARYFELSLVGLEGDNATSRMTAEAVVFGSGRPAILLPEKPSGPDFRNVAIAWDGSRVAARAVGDAAQLLQQATKITVLTVTDEKPLGHQDAGERLATVLQKRGLPAEAKPINAEDAPIATTLQEHAIECDAGLLVMGAFGHSRVRDFVLGGATEGTLSDLRLPVLLSH